MTFNKLFSTVAVLGLLTWQTFAADVDLKAGWNLVSGPIGNLTTDDSVDVVFTKNSLGILTDATGIEDGKAGWVKATGATSYTLEDSSITSSADYASLISSEWNLLGAPIELSVSDLQSQDICSDQCQIFTMNSLGILSSITDGSIEAGQGFWIRQSPDYVADSTTTAESTTIETVSNNTEINTTMLTPNAVETNTSTYDIVEVNQTVINISKTYEEAQEDLDKNLFIDGMFRGVVDEVTDNGDGSVTYSMREAESFEEVFSSFSIQMTNDEIIERIKRQMPAKIGKYDHLNNEPLDYTFHERVVTERSTGRKTKQITMRVHFPKDYYIPIDPKAVEFDYDCDVWDANCRVTAEASQNISMDASTTRYGITMSTEGSYIEFGIGAYVYANYDCGWSWFACRDEQYEFEYGGDAYFETELIFGLNGKLTKTWTTTLNVLDPIAVTIVPASATYGVVQVNIAFDPQLELGASGTIEGDATARAYIKREGEVGFKYSTRDGDPQKWDKTTTASYDKTDEASIGIEAKLEASTWVYPYLESYPELKFFMVAPSITMVKLRAGAKAEGELSGEFAAGMEIVNSEFNSYLNAGICANIDLTPSIDYKFQFKFGDTNIYPSSDVSYSSLYSYSFEIFEWCMELLDSPTINTETDEDGMILVTFDAELDEDQSPYKKFYYTLDGTEPTVENGTLWDYEPVSVAEGTTVKVFVKVDNADISTSYWAFGSSYSLVVTQVVSGDSSDDAGDEFTEG